MGEVQRWRATPEIQTQLGLRFRAILDNGFRDTRFERATSKTEAGDRCGPFYTDAQ